MTKLEILELALYQQIDNMTRIGSEYKKNPNEANKVIYDRNVAKYQELYKMFHKEAAKNNK